MSLSVEIKEKGLAIAKEATIYGCKFEDLDRDELIAVAALGWKAYTDQLDSVTGLRTK